MDDTPVPMHGHLDKRDAVHWKEFTCGWGAALFSILLTYPFNKLMFRQMLHGISFFSAARQLQQEGLFYLYRGILPPLLQKTCSTSMMFGFYYQIRKPLLDHGIDPYVAKVTASAISGVSEGVLTPFERILVLLANHNYHNHFKNTYDAFKQIGSKYGPREYYRGFIPIVLRNGSEAVMFFVAKEELLAITPEPTNELERAMEHFVFGAVIGACMSTLVFPVNVAKVQMQSRIGGKFERIDKVLREVYVQRGRKLRHIYTGAGANCFKAFMAWGFLNAAYEQMRRLLY